MIKRTSNWYASEVRRWMRLANLTKDLERRDYALGRARLAQVLARWVGAREQQRWRPTGGSDRRKEAVS